MIWTKSGCSSYNRRLEHRGPSDTRNNHILCTEECFKNDITKESAVLDDNSATLYCRR